MSTQKKRTYARLDRIDRIAIEEGLRKKKGVREIAQSLGRSPSTISHEVKANRTIEKGGTRGSLVDEVPDDACARLKAFPFVCNGCNAFRFNCEHPFRVEYLGGRANKVAIERRSDTRRGVDRSEASLSMALSTIKGDLARGLSPAQIADGRALELNTSSSTIYRWIQKGYCNMSNMELRRKVGYKQRVHKATSKPTAHGYRHSFAAFEKLDEDTRAYAVEMDTVIGLKKDTQCILTLYLRAYKFQFMLLLDEKSPSAVSAALGILKIAAGPSLFYELFAIILTDNGLEFSDAASIERTGSGHIKLYYCDVARSFQKAGCERNHVEIRKVLPKRQGISFDALDQHDLVNVMNHVNSQPRPSLGFLSPIALMKASLKERIEPLFDALGIKEIPYDDLLLTKELLTKRGDALS